MRFLISERATAYFAYAQPKFSGGFCLRSVSSNKLPTLVHFHGFPDCPNNPLSQCFDTVPDIVLWCAPLQVLHPIVRFIIVNVVHLW